MPFAKCKQCGRLFHTFEPLMPDAPQRFAPNLSQGDEIYEFCKECLEKRRAAPQSTDPNRRARGDATR